MKSRADIRTDTEAALVAAVVAEVREWRTVMPITNYKALLQTLKEVQRYTAHYEIPVEGAWEEAFYARV